MPSGFGEPAIRPAARRGSLAARSRDLVLRETRREDTRAFSASSFEMMTNLHVATRTRFMGAWPSCGGLGKHPLQLPEDERRAAWHGGYVQRRVHLERQMLCERPFVEPEFGVTVVHESPNRRHQAVVVSSAGEGPQLVKPAALRTRNTSISMDGVIFQRETEWRAPKRADGLARCASVHQFIPCKSTAYITSNHTTNVFVRRHHIRFCGRGRKGRAPERPLPTRSSQQRPLPVWLRLQWRGPSQRQKHGSRTAFPPGRLARQHLERAPPGSEPEDQCSLDLLAGRVRGDPTSSVSPAPPWRRR